MLVVRTSISLRLASRPEIAPSSFTGSSRSCLFCGAGSLLACWAGSLLPRLLGWIAPSSYGSKRATQREEGTNQPGREVATQQEESTSKHGMEGATLLALGRTKHPEAEGTTYHEVKARHS